LRAFLGFYLILQERTVLIASFILGFVVYLAILKSVCSPISPQALIVDTMS